jgi:hypothetical protein
MADGTYSWRVLKEQDIPNALEEVAMKLSTMPAVLELSNTTETSEQVAEHWVWSKHYARAWREAFVRARGGVERKAIAQKIA